MNDKQIDAYITRQIRKRGITLYDIVGGQSIDPEPDNWTKSYQERVRCNKFITDTFPSRLCELLTDKRKFDPEHPYDNLKILLKDLVRYWWNNIVDQEDILFEILDGIMTIFKDRMLPPQPEEEPPDYSDAFDDVPL
jgi:hypothetical protein